MSGRLIAQRYRIEETLGRGGMGSVYRVLDESTGTQLALKLASGGAVAGLELEYRTLAHLRHPHLVAAHDYGREQDDAWYTMELLGGGDLLPLAPLPWQRVCAILADVVSGLSALHVRRLLHRDISARNVRFGRDGRVKLIDLGALAPFGPPANVSGTPAFVSPEALQGEALDQRSDLFSVGALAYYLLTGLNAFPASSLAEQQALLGRGYRPARERVLALSREDLEPPPAELDALIESLLQPDRSARPRDAADVLDRLNGLMPSVHEERTLPVPAYVARELDSDSLRRRLDRTLVGAGSAVLVEGVEGVGRTRLLSELAIEARIVGASVLTVSARDHAGLLGVADAVAQRLLQALPIHARSAAGSLAPTLAHLSQAVQDQLQVPPSARVVMPQTPGEKRMRLQSALEQWFERVARDFPVVILIDDLQLCDEASVAWLATLAQRLRESKLMVVCTLRPDEAREDAPALGALRAASARIRLAPLDREGTRSLVRSLFGDAQHLERVAELVHRRAGGLPAYCLELLELMLRLGLVRNVEGAWVLSQNISDAQLPASRTELVLASVRRLSKPARTLGAVLAVRDRLISPALCTELAELTSDPTEAALEELLRESVLARDESGYRFTSEIVHRALLAELPDELSKRAHRVLGQRMLASPELGMDERLQAGVHLLRGGDEQGRGVVARAGLALGLDGLVFLGSAVEPLQQAYRMLKERGASDYELITVLGPLALAGYYADRRLADRYGEEALTKLRKLLGLERARRMQRWLGRKLGLLLSLAITAIQLRRAGRRQVGPSFREAMMLIFNVVSCLSGVYTICIDARRAHKCAAAIEPLTALGKDHVATLIHAFCLNLAGTVQDRLSTAYARWERMTDRLEARTPIEGLPEHVRVLYLAGALYARGVMECWRDDGHALAIADKLDGLKLKLYEMSADQVRMMYYANQGRQELLDHYSKRVEMHAIQRGTAWQVETWSAGALITPLLRMHDSLGMKHTAERLRDLTTQVPMFSIYAQRARGAHLLLRGRPAEALADLERAREEGPHEIVGWARSHGVLARAYNALAAHARARTLCQETLATLDPGDLQFTAMNLGLEIELALAHAGLGEVATAADALDALLAKHAPHRGPLTMGALHEARAQVALCADDAKGVRHHHDEMERWYRETGCPSLLEHVQRLRRTHERGASEPQPGDDEAVHTLLHRLAHGGGQERTLFGLDAIVEFASLDRAYLVTVANDSQITERGPSAPVELAQWMQARLEAERNGDEVTEAVSELSMGDDPNLTAVGELHFRALPLFDPASGDAPVGLLVVPAERARSIPHGALDLLAARVVESAREAS